MEYTSLIGGRRRSVASSPNDALRIIIPDHALPETRHLAGFVALVCAGHLFLILLNIIVRGIGRR